VSTQLSLVELGSLILDREFLTNLLEVYLNCIIQDRTLKSLQPYGMGFSDKNYLYIVRVTSLLLDSASSVGITFK
jgi:hypothetical protein